LGQISLTVNHLAKSKIIPDSDDLCDHHYRGFSFDDDALSGAPIKISLVLFAWRACQAFFARPVIGLAGIADQACPLNRQDHLPDQNDLYAHDA
jgi:hypothetical protein